MVGCALETASNISVAVAWLASRQTASNTSLRWMVFLDGMIQAADLAVFWNGVPFADIMGALPLYAAGGLRRQF